MLILNQPAIADIEALVTRIPRFPFSVRQLIRLAREHHFTEEVINFFKIFPSDEVFEDADDLITRVEQVEMMREEEAHQPQDSWLVPEED